MRKFICAVVVLAICAGLCFAGSSAFARAESSNDEIAGSGAAGRVLSVLEIDDESSLAEVDTEKIDAAVMKFTLSGDIAGKNGEAIANAAELAAKLTVKGVALVYRIDELATLEAFKSYYVASGIKDAAVASSSAAVLIEAAEIKNLNIYYVAENVSERTECTGAITQANAFGAQTIILSGTTDYDSVRYIQSRLKSVWVTAESDKISAANALSLGAYGVISSSVKNLNEVTSLVNTAVKSEKGYVLGRSPYIIAHRGLTTIHTENSTGAITDAAKAGANHVEIDIRKTKDGEIVLLHDDDIRYAMKNADGTAASGKVSNMTLAELKALKMSDMTSRIATLDEIFEAALTKEAENLILLIEIKGEEPELINLFTNKVREYDIADRIAVISFYPAQILRMRSSLPEIPTSILLYTTGGADALEQAESVKSGISMQYNGRGGMKAFYGDGGTKEAYETAYDYFAKRGYPLWLWTYGSDSMKEAVKNGVTGITTDDPVTYTADEVEKLTPGAVVSVDKLPENGDETTIKAKTYKGNEIEVAARVVVLESTEQEVKAVLVYDGGAFGLASGAVTFEKTKTPESSGGGSASGGCGGSLGGPFALCGAIFAAAAVISKKRKK